MPAASPASHFAQVQALDIGESCAIVTRWMLDPITGKELFAEAHRLAQLGRQAVMRVKRIAGNGDRVYTVEQIHAQTSGLDPVVMALITRTE